MQTKQQASGSCTAQILPHRMHFCSWFMCEAEKRKCSLTRMVSSSPLQFCAFTQDLRLIKCHRGGIFLIKSKNMPAFFVACFSFWPTEEFLATSPSERNVSRKANCGNVNTAAISRTNKHHAESPYYYFTLWSFQHEVNGRTLSNVKRSHTEPMDTQRITVSSVFWLLRFCWCASSMYKHCGSPDYKWCSFFLLYI